MYRVPDHSVWRNYLPVRVEWSRGSHVCLPRMCVFPPEMTFRPSMISCFVCFPHPTTLNQFEPGIRRQNIFRFKDRKQLWKQWRRRRRHNSCTWTDHDSRTSPRGHRENCRLHVQNHRPWAVRLSKGWKSQWWASHYPDSWSLYRHGIFNFLPEHCESFFSDTAQPQAVQKESQPTKVLFQVALVSVL